LKIVTVRQAKTNLSRLIRKASEGEEVVIARGSKPVARLVPVGEVKGKRRPASGPNSLSLFRSANLPAGSGELARLAGHDSQQREHI